MAGRVTDAAARKSALLDAEAWASAVRADDERVIGYDDSLRRLA